MCKVIIHSVFNAECSCLPPGYFHLCLFVWLIPVKLQRNIEPFVFLGMKQTKKKGPRFQAPNPSSRTKMASAQTNTETEYQPGPQQT